MLCILVVVFLNLLTKWNACYVPILYNIYLLYTTYENELMRSVRQDDLMPLWIFVSFFFFDSIWTACAALMCAFFEFFLFLNFNLPKIYFGGSGNSSGEPPTDFDYEPLGNWVIFSCLLFIKVIFVMNFWPYAWQVQKKRSLGASIWCCCCCWWWQLGKWVCSC